jgi:hypothetical protein
MADSSRCFTSFVSPKTVTNILPNVHRKQQGWKLTEVEVVDDAQRLRSRRAVSERACEILAIVLG